MKLGYVDTSCLVAIVFDEPGAQVMARRLRSFDRLFSSNLLEAEVRAAVARERLTYSGEMLFKWITWVYPNRPLSQEFDRALVAAPLRGADLWHLACALFLAPEANKLTFLTLDKRQKEVATRLGFPS